MPPVATITLENIHLVPKSNNRKTGPLVVTYRDMDTCPKTCPFLPTGQYGGCYGTGRLFASAKRYSGPLDLEMAIWKVRLGKDPNARYLRDRVVGDVLTPEGNLDRDYIAGIVQVAVASGLIAFGYTHAWRDFTRADVAFLRLSGYVMNASTESVEDAETALAAGLPAVMVNDNVDEGTVVAGRRVVTCPAETRPGEVTCASCGLCAKPDRTALVRFTTHGTAAAKARAAVAAVATKEVAAA